MSREDKPTETGPQREYTPRQRKLLRLYDGMGVLQIVGAGLIVLATGYELVEASNPHASAPTTTSAGKHNMSNSRDASKQKETAKDAAVVRQLAAEAVSKFETDLKKGSTTIWAFAGVCAMIGESRASTSGSQSSTYYEIPTPGLVHITDPSNDSVITEAIGWDAIDNKFVTGLISVFGKSRTPKDSYNLKPYDQFNIYYGNAQVETVKVDFAKGNDQIMDEAIDSPIMDVQGWIVATSPKNATSKPKVKYVCEQDLSVTASAATVTQKS
jgi:hypothetical protein